MFRNSPQPTKTESEKAFGLDLRQHAGQREGFHSEHLRGCGLHHPAGFGEHNGDVDSRTNAGSRCIKDFGLQRQTMLGLFVSEAMSLSIAGGLFGCGFAWLLLTRDETFAHELFPGQMQVTLGMLGSGPDGGGPGGIFQLADSLLPRVADKDCGWAAAYRLNL